MLEKISKLTAALHNVPNDFWAIVVLVHGAILVALGHKDEGSLVIGGALAIFKGTNNQPQG